MRIHKFNIKEDLGKEYSIKLLPNIDNLQENVKYIDKYYEDKTEISRQEYWKARTSDEKRNVYRIEKYVSFAMVNGEYCLLPFNRTIRNFVGYAADGKYYKINPKTSNHLEKYYSIEEYKEFRKSSLYQDMEEDNLLHLIEKIKFDTPINLYDISHDWSIKFIVSEVRGYLLFENIRIERDSANLIWDGTVETQESVKSFLDNKELYLKDYTINI